MCWTYIRTPWGIIFGRLKKMKIALVTGMWAILKSAIIHTHTFLSAVRAILVLQGETHFSGTRVLYVSLHALSHRKHLLACSVNLKINKIFYQFWFSFALCSISNSSFPAPCYSSWCKNQFMFQSGKDSRSDALKLLSFFSFFLFFYFEFMVSPDWRVITSEANVVLFQILDTAIGFYLLFHTDVGLPSPIPSNSPSLLYLPPQGCQGTVSPCICVGVRLDKRGVGWKRRERHQWMKSLQRSTRYPALLF